MPEQTEPTNPALEPSQEAAKIIPAPAQAKPTGGPAAKTKPAGDDRDDFIRNALPVAAALRRSGKPEEAKQLERVANALLQTKSMERAPAQEPGAAKEESIKDLLASVYQAIDQDPALKNMPEAKDLRRAGNKLDKDGMLNITVRNGLVVSFVSNFTDNFSRTQQVGTAAPEPKPVVAQAAAAPGAAALPTQAPQPVPAAPFTRADISAEELAKVGVSVADLEKSGQLQKLLEGKKTDLIPFALPSSNGVAIPFEAKLVLQRDAQGAASLRVDLPKHELEIPKQIMGKDVTPAMQVQLQANGVVPLAGGFQDGQGQPFAAYLAVDKEMKRVVAVRPAGITLPQEVHGVQLSPEQRKLLLEGRPTRIEGMTNSKQQLVDATVQLDPLARKLTFRDSQPRAAQEQTQSQVQQPARRRGVGV